MSRAVRDLHVSFAINYASHLVAASEPVKAIQFLDNCTTEAVKRHPDVIALRDTLTQRTLHFFDDNEYVNRYSGKSAVAKLVETKPFSEIGLQRLFRFKIARTWINRCQTKKHCSIGGSDGSFPKLILEDNEEATVCFSELLPAEGEVSKALDSMFPNRTSRIGRFDIANEDLPEKEFDTIECMEVIEHVTDVDQLLINIRRALKDDGHVIISTPNTVDWYENTRLDEEWYPHVRAYTARSLAETLAGNGFMVKSCFVAEGIINVLAVKCEPNLFPFQNKVAPTAQGAIPPCEPFTHVDFAGNGVVASVECLDFVIPQDEAFDAAKKYEKQVTNYTVLCPILDGVLIGSGD